MSSQKNDASDLVGFVDTKIFLWYHLFITRRKMSHLYRWRGLIWFSGGEHLSRHGCMGVANLACDQSRWNAAAGRIFFFNRKIFFGL